MADRALHARAPLVGFGLPGRFGAASGKPGLVIEEGTDLALATGHGAAGKTAGAKLAVAAAYGLNLPDGPRAAARG